MFFDIHTGVCMPRLFNTKTTFGAKLLKVESVHKQIKCFFLFFFTSNYALYGIVFFQHL